MVDEIKELKEEVAELKKVIEKVNDDKDKCINTIAKGLEREQDKNEITVKTIKEITKQNAIKEVLILLIVVVFLLIYYMI